METEDMIGPSINWDHVSGKYRWLAVDRDGGFLSNVKPTYNRWKRIWDVSGFNVLVAEADVFSSFSPGNFLGENSLVERPSKA